MIYVDKFKSHNIAAQYLQQKSYPCLFNNDTSFIWTDMIWTLVYVSYKATSRSIFGVKKVSVIVQGCLI